MLSSACGMELQPVAEQAVAVTIPKDELRFWELDSAYIP